MSLVNSCSGCRVRRPRACSPPSCRNPSMLSAHSRWELRPSPYTRAGRTGRPACICPIDSLNSAQQRTVAFGSRAGLRSESRRVQPPSHRPPRSPYHRWCWYNRSPRNKMGLAIKVQQTVGCASNARHRAGASASCLGYANSPRSLATYFVTRRCGSWVGLTCSAEISTFGPSAPTRLMA
jgi:hypothetical protein